MSAILKSIREKRGLRRYVGPKRALLLLALVAFMFWVWNCYRNGALSSAIVEQYRENHPVGAVLLFILVYTASVIANVPSLPLNLAAGFFWGGVLGGIYATLGMTIGGWISFSAARLLIGQPLAGKVDNKWANRVQREFQKNGWKFVAFARINPIIPTGPLNYLLGMTSLSTRSFIWVTFIFLLPSAIAVAYVGDTFQAVAAQQSGANEIIRGALVASAAVTILAALKFASTIYRKAEDSR